MIRGCFAFFTLLGSTIWPGAIKSLLGEKNCILGRDRFAIFIYFRGIIRVSGCKIVLRLTLYTLYNFKIIDFSYDFILEDLKSVTQNGSRLIVRDFILAFFMRTFRETIGSDKLSFNV